VASATGPSSAESAEQELARGGELLRQGQVAEALRAFQSALAISPGNPRALSLLGLTYFRAGSFAAARPVYEELVKILPADASHHFNLGLVYLKLGEADSAVKSLETSRNLDPSQGRAASYLGLAYARGGRYVEAYQAFLQAGQADLAKEVEEHLTPVEKAAIQIHLEEQRNPPRSALPPQGAQAATAPVEQVTDDEPSASMRFVAPDGSSPEIQILRDPEAAPADPIGGAISNAIAAVEPAAVTTVAPKVAAGSTAPMPLSEFATSRLVRPEDGDQPFEISATGVLVVRVTDRVFSRTEGVDVTGGKLAYEPATRRSRGAQTNEPFDSGGRPMFLVSGKGHLVAVPLGGVFTAVQLDDDILYLREDIVFAFEAGLRWENGHVPGSRSRIRMVQFRGDGAVAFRSKRPLLAVKLSAPSVLYVDAAAIAGWIGRVVPRAVAPAGSGTLAELFVECTGEGVVLVEEDTGAPPPTLAALPVDDDDVADDDA
jgi:hypothetical protein